MRTYRELFRTPEFAPLFGASCAQVAATTLAGLALATLVYARTESPLLSALSMFGPSFASLIGATTQLSVADRVPPRTALTLVAGAAALAGLLLATPGLSLPAMFAVILAQGVATSIGAGVLYGLLGEILPPDGYVLGRSVLNMSVGAMQVAGFALGGVLIAVVSPRTTTLAGLTARLLPVGTTMTALAVVSLAVTAVLSPGLRLSDPRIAVRRATHRGTTPAQLTEAAA